MTTNKDHQQSPANLISNLGPSTWAFMHTIAAHYPTHPTPVQQVHMRRLIHGISHFFPCSYCAHDFRRQIRKFPVRAENREALSVWVCERHNDVNEKLGKPIVPCDRIWEKWSAAKNQGPLYLSDVESSNEKDEDDDYGSAPVFNRNEQQANDENDENEDAYDDLGDDDDDDDELILPDDCSFCETTMGKERFQEMRALLTQKKQK